MDLHEIKSLFLRFVSLVSLILLSADNGENTRGAQVSAPALLHVQGEKKSSKMTPQNSARHTSRREKLSLLTVCTHCYEKQAHWQYASQVRLLLRCNFCWGTPHLFPFSNETHSGNQTFPCKIHLCWHNPHMIRLAVSSCFFCPFLIF